MISRCPFSLNHSVISDSAIIQMVQETRTTGRKFTARVRQYISHTREVVFHNGETEGKDRDGICMSDSNTERGCWYPLGLSCTHLRLK